MAAVAFAAGGVAFAGMASTSSAASIEVPFVQSKLAPMPVEHHRPISLPDEFERQVEMPEDAVLPGVEQIFAEEPDFGDWDDCPGCGMG